jgi:hypothetical protein
VPGQLAIDRFENAFAGAGLDQALPESPDRHPIRDLATGAQTDEALEAQAIKQLELICSSLRLNNCWINSTRTINSVGKGGRPPRSRLGRGAA